MTFLDTGLMGGAHLKSHFEYETCLAALEDSTRPFTNTHGLAETFATLKGIYEMATAVATELTLSNQDSIAVEVRTLVSLKTVQFPPLNVCVY